MTEDIEEYVVEIAELENRKFDNRFKIDSLTALKRQAAHGEVGDSPSIYRINGYRPDDDSIIIVSNLQFPDFVSDAVQLTGEVAANLAAP